MCDSYNKSDWFTSHHTYNYDYDVFINLHFKPLAILLTGVQNLNLKIVRKPSFSIKKSFWKILACHNNFVQFNSKKYFNVLKLYQIISTLTESGEMNSSAEVP